MKYDLVFEGGGAKGMVFVGACDELFGRGHTFSRLLGTSAGAITAALLAAGYTPAELSSALQEKENGKSVFAGFMGDPPPFSDEEISQGALRKMLEAIDFKFLFDRWEKKLDDKLARTLAGDQRFRHVLALVERGGWFSAERFVSWLKTRLDSGTHNGAARRFSALTLAQLFAATGVELSVVAADTADAKILVLNHHTAPDCPVVWAVRMSMSIPLIWDEVIWQASWGQYLGRDMAGHAVVDGGLLSSFPIELFISGEPQVTRLMGPKQDTPVLGMLIDERLPVAAAKGWLVGVNMKLGELQTVQRLQRLVDTATTAHDKMVIEEYAHLVVRLPAQGYGTTEFDMSEARRAALIEAGRAAMALYLDRPAGIQLPTKARTADGRPQSTADRIATEILE